MFEGIDFGSGEVSPIRSYFEPEKPLCDQLDILRETMFHVRFSSSYVIDIGWYPSFSAQGRFIAFLVKEDDWDHPEEKVECGTYKEIVSAVGRLVRCI